ncbi:MAG: hypothetical protein K0R78_1492 [Pelosinus sp.]|jgi:hypothetical protein|nr:hypothetical protein [Pelosinus sp.]
MKKPIKHEVAKKYKEHEERIIFIYILQDFRIFAVKFFIFLGYEMLFRILIYNLKYIVGTVIATE